MAPRVCVIGAGASGVAALHELSRFDFSVTCYETRSEPGGAWLYDADPGDAQLAFDDRGHPYVASSEERARGYPPSPMYAGLRTNIPSEGMACRRQPFPEETAMFPTQAVVLCYLQNRAKQVAQYIRYGTVVTRVRKDEGATKWTVETRSLASGDLASEDYDYVLVANGHYSQPYVPPIPGLTSWGGQISHSRWWRTPEHLADKTVLVVGSSASGGDIARELSRLREKVKGRKVYQSIRSEQRNGIDPRDPAAPSWARYIDVVPGLDRIDPTNDPKSNGRIVCGDRVLDDVDVIIFATGYLFSFPFLSAADTSFASLPLTREPPFLGKGAIHSNGHANGDRDHSAAALGGLRVHSLDPASSLFYRADTTIAFPALAIRVIPFPLAEAQARVISKIWAGQAPRDLDLSRPAPRFECPASTVPEDVEDKAAHYYGGQSEFDYQDHILRLVGEGVGPEVGEDGSFGATPAWRRELRSKNAQLRLEQLGY